MANATGFAFGNKYNLNWQKETQVKLVNFMSEVLALLKVKKEIFYVRHNTFTKREKVGPTFRSVPSNFFYFSTG
jgi:hypothetical protein